VISEQSGKIVYVKNGQFYTVNNTKELRDFLTQDLSI